VWAIIIIGVPTILTTLYHMHQYIFAAAGDVVKYFIKVMGAVCLIIFIE
jgi:hypothetical protein